MQRLHKLQNTAVTFNMLKLTKEKPIYNNMELAD